MLAEECFGGHPPCAWEKIIRRATAALPRQRYAGVKPMLRAIRRRHWARNWTWALLAALGIALTITILSREVREARQATTSQGEEPRAEEAEQIRGKEEREPEITEQAPSPMREAERTREMAVLRASEGSGKEVIEGLLRDMVVLEGADKLRNTLREALGVPSGQVLVGRHEVTQAQWETLMETNPSRFMGTDRPVDGVNIGDCLEFIGRLNRMPDVREAGVRFRLPTMGEWKMAAGDHLASRHDYWHKFAMAMDNPGSIPPSDSPGGTGWFAENSGGETHPVGQTPPNEHGLYDCYGNVSEPVFSVSELQSPPDSFSVTGLSCMGGNFLQRQVNSSTPVLLGVLGREIETLPEEWQPVIRATGIPVRLPEAMLAANPDRAAKFLGKGVGLRLCADKMPEGER